MTEWVWGIRFSLFIKKKVIFLEVVALGEKTVVKEAITSADVSYGFFFFQYQNFSLIIFLTPTVIVATA